jgi:hypothetical protein
MTIRKVFVSLVVLVFLALTVVACSGTKNICPAYTTIEEVTPGNNS